MFRTSGCDGVESTQRSPGCVFVASVQLLIRVPEALSPVLIPAPSLHWQMHRKEGAGIGGTMSTPLADRFDMGTVARSIDRLAEVVGRVFGRLAAVVVGLILIVAGIAMTATIVMLPAGIVTLLIGVAVFVGGMFRPR